MHITSCSLFCNNHGDGNYGSNGNYGSDTIAPIIPILFITSSYFIFVICFNIIL